MVFVLFDFLLLGLLELIYFALSCIGAGLLLMFCRFHNLSLGRRHQVAPVFYESKALSVYSTLLSLSHV